MCRAVRTAANSVPATNRIIGPNIGAASEPVKYSPGTDDPNVPRSAGALEPGTQATTRRTVGDRNGRASRSSR